MTGFNDTDLRPGIAVDIDETLSWTVWFWMRQLQHLFGNPEKLTPEEMVEKYQYTQRVPYWQSKEALQWMEHHIRSDRLQENLPEVKDAHLLNDVSKVIPIAAYITARPHHVLHGTKVWLKKHGFPEAPIIAMPDNIDHKDCNGWKANILKELYPTVKGIIDDNQKLISELGDDYEGKVFAFGHTKLADPKPFAIPCKDWEDVVAKVNESFKI